MRPTEFDDLVALNALYRPGAMDQIPTYARGKRDRTTVAIPDERLEPIIGPTYGVVLYQEQAMLISKELAGFSGCQGGRPAQGDRQEEPRGDGRARARVPRGLPRPMARARRASSTGSGTTNEKSADYSFNKSHAACYALIAYRTAWLKANYPAEYMAALISSVMDTKDKVPFFVAQTEDMGIEILPPDVNLSDHEFVVVDGNIRFGLDAVKGVGFAAVEAIKAAREDGGPFASIWDFCARVDPRAVNKRAIEALIKCGAFGSTGATRKGMLGSSSRPRPPGQKAQLDAQIGQGSIFDLAGDVGGGDAGAASPFMRAAAPADPARGVRAGRAARPSRRRPSGSSSPRTRSRRCARPCAPPSTPRSPTLPERKDGDWVTAGGIITQAKKIRTKKGDPMMFATLDDLEGVDRGPGLRQGARRVRGRARRRRGRARARARRSRRTRARRSSRRRSIRSGPASRRSRRRARRPPWSRRARRR